jgi:putative flippase GtrA
MQGTKTKSSKLKQHLLGFILVGLFATGFDFIIYSLLHVYLSYSIAKACSFLSGSCLVYLLNKFFTFKQPKHSQAEMLRFLILYSLTLCANVLVNSLSLAMLPNWVKPINLLLNPQEIIILAFIIATGVSTILNFFGQKFWVFRSAL